MDMKWLQDDPVKKVVDRQIAMMQECDSIREDIYHLFEKCADDREVWDIYITLTQDIYFLMRKRKGAPIEEGDL